MRTDPAGSAPAGLAPGNHAGRCFAPRRRASALAGAAFALVACGKGGARAGAGGGGAAASVGERAPAAPSGSFGAAPVPAGHWEAEGGPAAPDVFCLTIYPYGGVRLVAGGAGLRNPARITGTIVASAGGGGRFEFTIEVARIVAKSLGPCRRAWHDLPLAEANVLGTRVAAGGRDGGAPPSRARFSLRSDDGWATVDLCALDGPAPAAAPPTPRCRVLARRPATHTFVRPPPAGGCATDADCSAGPAGEVCAPCACTFEAFRTPKHGDGGDGPARARDECPPLPAAPCPPCPWPRAACRAGRCELVPPSAP
jgi:hypothetical protein